MKKFWLIVAVLTLSPLIIAAEEKIPFEAFLGLHYNAMEMPSNAGDSLPAIVLNTRAELAVSYEYALLPFLELGAEVSLALFPYFEDEDGDEQLDVVLADYEFRLKGSYVVSPGIEVEALGGWFYYYPDALGDGEFWAYDFGCRLRLSGAYFEASYIYPMDDAIHPMDGVMLLEPYWRFGVGYTI